MQPAGLFVMIASVGTVTALFGWCLWQVLAQPLAPSVFDSEVKRWRIS